MHAPDNFRQLMDKYMTNSVSAAEKEELFSMIRQVEHQSELEQIIDDALEVFVEGEEDLVLREEIFTRLQARRQPVKKLKVWRYAGAAAVILVLLGTAFYRTLKPEATLPGKITVISHIRPGTDKAVLTLADGSRIALDSNGHREIKLDQGAATASQQHGQLVYNAADNAADVGYNTLQTPRGGEFRVVLPDGTRIWLNAASSVTYPTAFIDGERKISITGEVYLEVQPDDKPFIVSTPHQQVQVLGTQFNINAYEEESVTKTTLLTGKIKVLHKTDNVVLKPGQQAVIMHETSSAIPIREVDAEQAVAWKNGYFDFENEHLDVVLRLLSRWYNIDFETEKVVARLKFSVAMARSSSLDQVLSALAATGVVTFFKEDNRIKVYLTK